MPYAHKEDCFIDRADRPGKAILLNEEGTRLATFETDMTDAQIMSALDFANDAWARGVKFGNEQKAGEIRAVLGVPPIASGD